MTKIGKLEQINHSRRRLFGAAAVSAAAAQLGLTRPSSYAQKFSGRYEHRTITGGTGHNLPQEAPQAFAQAIVDIGVA
jgi:hypothetical protein